MMAGDDEFEMVRVSHLVAVRSRNFILQKTHIK
jgi:hypothetical protein